MINLCLWSTSSKEQYLTNDWVLVHTRTRTRTRNTQYMTITQVSAEFHNWRLFASERFTCTRTVSTVLGVIKKWKDIFHPHLIRGCRKASGSREDWKSALQTSSTLGLYCLRLRTIELSLSDFLSTPFSPFLSLSIYSSLSIVFFFCPSHYHYSSNFPYY